MTTNIDLFFLATKVSIERKNMLTLDEVTKLQGLYRQMLGPAMEIHRKDSAERGKQKKKNSLLLFCFPSS